MDKLAAKQPPDARHGCRRIGFLGGLPAERYLLPLVLLITAFLYAKTFTYPFILDDNMQIVGNRHIMDAGYVRTYFTQDLWSHLPGKHLDAYYRPLLLLWFRANYVFFGDSSFYWHLSTVLMHLLCTTLVYVLALRFVADRMSAAVAAALYGVHPIQVEGVAWISGVNGSLCAVFVLMTLLCYLEFKKSKRDLWLAASVIGFAAALLAKESAMPFAAVILAYEWFAGTKRYRIAIPYFLVTGLYAIARVHALAAPLGTVQGRFQMAQLMNLPWLLSIYARMLFLPNRLSVFYDFWSVQRLSDPRFWLPLLIMGAVALTCFVKSKRATFFLMWFLILLSPAFAYACVSMSGEVYNGRQLCLPLVPFCIGLAMAVEQTRSKYGLATFVLVLLPLAWMQTNYWANSRLLFRHAYETSPTSYLAATTYIDQLVPEHEYEKAIQVGRSALVYHPDQVVLREALARVEFLSGRYADAAADYEQVTGKLSERPDVWFRLGFSYLYLRRDADAVIALRRAVRVNDQEPAYHYELGTALLNLHQQDEGLAEIGEAVQLAGDSQVGKAYARDFERLKASASGSAVEPHDEISQSSAKILTVHR